MIYSHSRIECFSECPRKFCLRYIDKIEIEDFETIERYMGKKVHDVLEHTYNKAMDGVELSTEEIIDYYNNIWDKDIGEHVLVINENNHQGTYHEKGRKCIIDYVKRHAPFKDVNTIATEMRINIDLKNDGNYKLVGFIDRVDKVGKATYEIHDYKTSAKMISQNKADLDRQLAIYEMGLRNRFSDIQQVDYIWHFLAHDKRIRSKRDEEKLKKHEKEIISSIHKIEEAIVEDWYPPIRTPRCKWCEYNEICLKNENFDNTRQTRLI